MSLDSSFPSSFPPKISDQTMPDNHNSPDMLAPLIPKTPTTINSPSSAQQQHENPNKTLLSLALAEARSIASISLPMVLTGLLLYTRSAVSMLFLGRLGNLALAGGSLALGFANITGYSVLSGLAMGMEPICSQAFGSQRFKLLGLALQRTVLLLLVTSIPISFLWLNMKRILLLFGQDADIASEAQSYILFSLPDLIFQSLLHPIRNYLRSQSITLPLTYCSGLSVLLHIPINYLLVDVLGFGIGGVALGAVWTNINLLTSLVLYIVISGVYKKTWCPISSECLRGFRSLMDLAIPSCVSVCLEWWWYEIMILLCGLLLNPRATVASMGILIQTTALIYIFPSSLSFGVSTRVGNELGAGRPEQARLATAIGLFGSSLLGLSALFFALSVRRVWAGMFTDEPEIISLTASVLPIIGLCELGNCPQTTGCGVLRGTARPRLGANVNLGCFYAVGMPVAVWLGFFGRLDFKGLWLGLLAAQGSCALTMLAIVARTDWAHEADRARELTGAASCSLGAADGGDREDGTLLKEDENSWRSRGYSNDNAAA